MEEKNYNEVVAKDFMDGIIARRKGEVIRTVRIREEEAEILNKDSKYTNLEYILAEEKEEKKAGRPAKEK